MIGMAIRQLPTRDDVYQAIRLHTGDSLATEADVLSTASDLAGVDREAVAEVYEALRRKGEIYSYPRGGVTVVRITDEVL